MVERLERSAERYIYDENRVKSPFCKMSRTIQYLRELIKKCRIFFCKSPSIVSCSLQVQMCKFFYQLPEYLLFLSFFERQKP